MCGIVGAIADRDVVPVLIEGLKRLEYRGYDSAGVAVVRGHDVHRIRRTGRVAEMEAAAIAEDLHARLGIGHTRWATHGGVTESNAHPHVSHDLALVHNGIIENHEQQRERLKALGYVFESQTDTEVIAHLIHHCMAGGDDLLAALQRAVKELDGAYALAVVSKGDPDRLVCARMGCPLLVGVGEGENFVASDVSAILQATRRVIFLEEGDTAEVTRSGVRIFDAADAEVVRDIHVSDVSLASLELGPYRHFMQKEIHEQPRALADTIEATIDGGFDASLFGADAEELLAGIEGVQILACGTSYYSGHDRALLDRIHCRVAVFSVEIASEYRYRDAAYANPRHLIVTISQSGETLDTMEALKYAKVAGPPDKTLSICNVPESAIPRASRTGLLHPRRRRDRRGLDQGLHHPAGRAVPADRGAGANCTGGIDARGRKRTTWSSCVSCRAACSMRLNMEPQIAAVGREVSRRKQQRVVPWSRPALPDRAGRRAQAEGNHLHPRRGLSGRRAQARSVGPGRRRHAGGGDRAQRQPAGEGQIQHAGSARARR